MRQLMMYQQLPLLWLYRRSAAARLDEDICRPQSLVNQGFCLAVFEGVTSGRRGFFGEQAGPRE